MARRGDELNAEAAEVPAHRVEHVDIQFATIATPGTDLPKFERAAKEPHQFLIHRRGQLEFPVRIDDQVLALPDGQAIILRVVYRSFGAGLQTIGAEQTAAKVQQRFGLEGDGLGWAGLGTGAAALGALLGVKNGPARKRSGMGGGGPSGYRMVR